MKAKEVEDCFESARNAEEKGAFVLFWPRTKDFVFGPPCHFLNFLNSIKIMAVQVNVTKKKQFFKGKLRWKII